MRTLLFALLVALALPVAAQTCIDPANTSPNYSPDNNPVYVPPIVPTVSGFGFVQYGSSFACPAFSSLGAYCAVACEGQHGSATRYVGTTPQCGCVDDQGTVSWGYGSPFEYVCNNMQPPGYMTWNSWKSTHENEFDTFIVSESGSVTRNADGNITAMTMPDDVGGTVSWSSSAWDSDKRVTNSTQPDGAAVSYAYYPNSTRVYSRTDSNGTTYYAYRNDDDTQPSTIILPDQHVVTYDYDPATGATTGVNVEGGSSAQLLALAGGSVLSYKSDVVWPIGDPALPHPEPFKGGCKDPDAVAVDELFYNCLRAIDIVCGTLGPFAPPWEIHMVSKCRAKFWNHCKKKM